MILVSTDLRHDFNTINVINKQLRSNLFSVIGYRDNESSKPKKILDFHAESKRFRVELRKTQFLDPRTESVFTSLNGDNLSEEMKSFSALAKQKRQTFLKETLLKQIATDTWLPIPVTEQEAEAQKNENTIKKANSLQLLIQCSFLFPS